MTASALGTIAIVLLLAWAFGGVLLRVGGALVLWAGLLGLVLTGNANGLLMVLMGGLAWLVGQAHYALRHGDAKSPLAASIFDAAAALLRRRHPSREWREGP